MSRYSACHLRAGTPHRIYPAPYVSDADALDRVIAAQLPSQTGDQSDLFYTNWPAIVLRRPNGREMLRKWEAYGGALPRWSTDWNSTPRIRPDGTFYIDAFSWYPLQKLTSLPGQQASPADAQASLQAPSRTIEARAVAQPRC